MALKIDAISFFLLAAFSASLTTAWIGWQQRKKPTAIPMGLFGFAASLWAFCYFFEYHSTTLNEMIFWGAAKYPAVVSLPVIVSVFVLRFSGWQTWPNKSTLLALLIIPIITLAAVFSWPSHQLFWYNLDTVKHETYTALTAQRGWLYWINVGYGYMLIIGSVGIAISMLSRTWQLYKQQIIGLFIGIFISMAGSLVSLFNLNPWPGIDLTPIMLGITSLILISISRLSGILNVVPLAHASVVDQMRDGVLVIDNHQRVVELNHAAARILNLQKQHIIGKTISHIEHTVFKTMRLALSGETVRHEQEIQQAETTEWYDVRISAIRTETGQVAGHMAIWHNITERKRIERELRHAATHDSLTGLYNRMYFEEEFERIMAGRRWPITVMMIDLDNLKKANDNFGHNAGDELIRSAGRVLTNTFRQDDLVARVGGDEFAIIIPLCDQKAAELLVQRLYENARLNNNAGPQVFLEFSTGFAVASKREEMADALVTADDRMYEHKRQRKGQRAADI